MPRNGQRKQPPGQRQLRVGEELRHALADIFMRGELHEPALEGASITVSEVRISPDLKNATAYVMPLGGSDASDIMPILEELAPSVRSLLGPKVHMKYTPRLKFRLDNSFEEAGRIHELLSRPEVQKDLDKEVEAEEK